MINMNNWKVWAGLMVALCIMWATSGCRHKTVSPNVKALPYEGIAPKHIQKDMKFRYGTDPEADRN